MRYLISLLVITWTVLSAVLTAAGVWSLPVLAVILPAIIWFGLALLVGIVIAIVALVVIVIAAVKTRQSGPGSVRTFGRI